MQLLGSGSFKLAFPNGRFMVTLWQYSLCYHGYETNSDGNHLHHCDWPASDVPWMPPSSGVQTVHPCTLAGCVALVRGKISAKLFICQCISELRKFRQGCMIFGNATLGVALSNIIVANRIA